MTKEQGREILAKITGGLTETDICSVMLTPKQTLSIAEYVEAIEKERDELRAAQPEQEPAAWMHDEHVRKYRDNTADGIYWANGKQTDFYTVPLYASPTAPAGDAVRRALSRAIAFIENTIEDGSECEAHDRALLAELVAALGKESL